MGTDLSWPKVQRHLARLVKEDRFFTEAELDNFADIDTAAVREQLAASGDISPAGQTPPAPTVREIFEHYKPPRYGPCHWNSSTVTKILSLQAGFASIFVLPTEIVSCWISKRSSCDSGQLSNNSFDIHYEQGVLPEVFPEPRGRVTRAEKAAAKAARAAAEESTAQEKPESAEAPEMPEEAPATEDSAAEIEAAPETEEAAEEAAAEATEADETSGSSTMEICYNVTGPRRKELATAVGDIIGMTPVYQKAPTYAFTIGEYTIDRNGTLIGKENTALTDALAEQGFTAA